MYSGSSLNHDRSSRPHRVYAAVTAVLAMLLVLAMATPAQAAPVTTNTVAADLSAYEWRRVDTTALTELSAGFAAFTAMGGTKISLDISYVATIAGMKNLKARQAAQTKFDAALKSYLVTANAAGLQVEALAGDPGWINPTKRSATTAIMNYVVAFNAASSANKLVGVHFDLEPWTLSAWSTGPVTPTKQWLDTIAAISAYQATLPAPQRLPLTFVVPFWLDGQAAPKTLNYGGVTDSPTAHIIRLLDNGAGQVNAVSVMAYRNLVAGSNGSAALSATEMALADATAGRVQAIIAQEVSNVEPATITFWQEGRGAMIAAMNDLYASYGSRPAFGGFAVNDFRSLALLP